jgi:hypothetical protein
MPPNGGLIRTVRIGCDLHTPVNALGHVLTEGLGVRAVARFVDCDPHTVLGVLETVGQKCEQLHDRLARNIKTESLQIDEIWSRVAISQKRAIPTEDQRGDFYTYLAVTADEKFIVSYSTAKRNYWSTDSFAEQLDDLNDFGVIKAQSIQRLRFGKSFPTTNTAEATHDSILVSEIGEVLGFAVTA